MTMVIVPRDGKYGALLTRPHGRDRYWSTKVFLPRDELIAVLLSKGCHQTDIGDLLAELDNDPQKPCAMLGGDPVPGNDTILVDETLQAVEVEFDHVTLVCGKTRIELNTVFSIAERGVKGFVVLDPGSRTGNLSPLWALVGQKCSKIVSSSGRLYIHVAEAIITVESQPRLTPELVNIWGTSGDEGTLRRFPADFD
ncbi:MAG: hypothetical protein U1E67_23740 [Hyphomicrobiales bacterium]